MKNAADRSRATEPDSVRSKFDATSVLTVYMVLLLGIPSEQAIAVLGGAGSPSTLFGLGMLLWWAWHQIRNADERKNRRLQPVRTALFIFLGCVLSSYILSSIRPMPYSDSTGATMTLINLASYAGVILVANDGIRESGRFVVMMRRLALFGGLYALVGVLQFFTGEDLLKSYQVPGLTWTGVEGVDMRGGFVRSESTARHPLEYAAVLAMLLPIALNLGISDTKRNMIRRFLPCVLMLLAAILSVTRSALLGIIVGLLILVPTWDRTTRLRALCAGAIGLVAVYITVPGLSGTIVGMFSGPDASVQSRTSSIGIAFNYLSLEPILGRGMGTLTPRYRIFDNQYLGMLIEIGIVGTLAFAALLIASIFSAFGRRPSMTRVVAGQGPALAGACIAGALLCAFFDAFHFPQAVGLLVLIIGLCGAHRNLGLEPLSPFQGGGERRARKTAVSGVWGVGAVVLRRWYAVCAVFLLMIPAVLATLDAKGVYYTKYEIGFDAPASATMNNALRTEGWSIVSYVAMVQRMYEAEYGNPDVIPTSAPLFGTGLRDATAVVLPNAGGQWQTNFSKPSISVEIVKATSAEVETTAEQVSAEIHRMAIAPQDQLSVQPNARISTVQRPHSIPISYENVRTRNALAGILMLGLAAAFGSAILLDRVVDRLSRMFNVQVGLQPRTTPPTIERAH